MNTIIEFLPDKYGNEPVLNLIKEIRGKVNTDPDMMQLFKFIMRGLEFLEAHGLGAIERYFVDETEGGRPYTIQLVKELRNHVPLLEFRVNWKNAGAFRCLFFEHRTDNMQLFLMVNAILKQTTYSEDFERIAVEAEELYHDFRKNPEKYIDLKGAEQYD